MCLMMNLHKTAGEEEKKVDFKFETTKTSVSRRALYSRDSQF